MSRFFINVLVPGPFFEPLIYSSDAMISAGVRVEVPLGSREVVGVCAGEANQPETLDSIKSIISVIDDEPIVSPQHWSLVGFASDYYLAPPGDLLLSSLPTTLRKGKPVPKPTTETGHNKPRAYSLTSDQQHAIEAVDQTANQFQCFLLQGVTGSGKTQVFSELIHRMIKRGQQVLLLVPEIGLAGQMVSSIRNQLDGELCVSHSGIANGARTKAFVASARGVADVLIGTRSALFTPMPNLGLILVDEEHDGAYKNQEGCRYSARDLAIVRAKQTNIPIVLSSATPSLETWQKAELGKYQRLCLLDRPGQQPQPTIRLIDVRYDKPKDGMSEAAQRAVRHAIDHGQQALVFLNRRGYSPILMCTDCGWIPGCKYCDAKPTLHRQPDSLWCHHCDHRQRPVSICPECAGHNLLAVGHGTERLEETLAKSFPEVPIIRVDRDTTARRRAFDQLIQPVIDGQPCILVGTQMLAKGHDFQKLSTVVITDADQGLSGADFRSVEHFAQLLTQVAGRAGRHGATGQVLIQTHRPDSEWFDKILRQDYDYLAKAMLLERQQFNWPPESHLALVTARASSPTPVFEALEEIADQIHALDSPIRVLGPAPAPMERRNRQYHGQLLILGKRSLIQWVLKETGPWAYKKRGKVVFQLDVDPWDLW